jgi:DNA-binding NarL/FixJ family response regulator
MRRAAIIDARRPTVRRLLLATRDQAAEEKLVAALVEAGFNVEVARTNLDLVWKLHDGVRAAGLTAVLLDTRPGSFGVEALHWLKDDPLPCALVALTHRDDTSAVQAAELAEAAGVVFVRRAELDAGAVVRDVGELLGRQSRDPLRWTLPRAPWLRAGSAPVTMRAAEA